MPNWVWTRPGRLLNKEQLAAYTYAVRLLARREYCEAELRARLDRREIEPDDCDAVIAQLRQDNYLSDERYAESFLRSRLRKGEAPWLAAAKARPRGVNEAALQGALSEIEDGFDAESRCRELLSMRDPAGRRFDNEREWQRQARFLRNKGFETAIVLRVLKERHADEA